jgi:predicted MPP superfamily phosphohydrolase
MFERYLFPYFFPGLAVGGAVAELGLVRWLVGLLGLTIPTVAQAAGVILLATLNVLAAHRLARGSERSLVGERAARAALAPAFGALACVAVLGATAALWAGARLLGALPVHAGLGMIVPSDPILGAAFRPVALLALATSVALLAHGYLRGYRRLVVRRFAVPLPHLAAPLAGLRLVHVSDLHLGPLTDRAVLRDMLGQIAALDPDLVCVTGDSADGTATDLAAWIPELDALTARHGVFVILGNHDRAAGAERVADALRRWTHWRVLDDEIATVEVGGARLHIVGLTDRRGDAATAALPALARALPADSAAILLAHHPKVFPTAAALGLPLTLAGHTHGGQLAVPGAPHLNVARALMTPFDGGWFARGDAALHVSRGLGTSGQRLRVGVPCEITVMTLSIGAPPTARAA